MTDKEAIYCMRSYLGETDCTKCPYYGLVPVDEQTSVCRSDSDEAHRAAVIALINKLSYDNVPKG